MRVPGRGIVGTALFLGALAAGALAKDARPSARDGFTSLVAIVTPSGEAAHPEAWPEALVSHRDWRGAPEQVQAWRREGVARLAAAEVLKVREDHDDAYVRVRLADGEAEVPLRWTAGRWALGAPREWLVRGAALDAANGEAAATIRLAAFTDPDSYGPSAFSFTYVTQDPKACLNRMDVWYCRNGDLHRAGDGGFQDLGRGRLEKAGTIGLGGPWTDTVRPRKGGLYVLHVRRPGRTDFFVRLRATAVSREEVSFEWSLLSLGDGAPASIHEAQPWHATDPNVGEPGADGAPGLCGTGG